MMHSTPSELGATGAAATAAVKPAAWGPARQRSLAAVIFAASFGLLLVAAWLQPAQAGHGTHLQLGLAPCGFLMTTGLPCATCGMTTAFSHAADGHLLRAFAVQPAGAVLAVLTAVVAVVSSYALVSGMAIAPLGRWLWRPRFALALGGLVIAGWAYTLFVAMGS